MVLVEEMNKRQPNGALISNLMDQTFSLRRKEIVIKEPAIQTIMERWPALFTEGQVSYFFMNGPCKFEISLDCIFESMFSSKEFLLLQ